MPRSMLVKDHMATDLVTLHPETEILRAAQVLISCDISGAPVLDRHGRLIGMLTERDCVRVALHAGYHGAPGGLLPQPPVMGRPRNSSPTPISRQHNTVISSVPRNNVMRQSPKSSKSTFSFSTPRSSSRCVTAATISGGPHR